MYFVRTLYLQYQTYPVRTAICIKFPIIYRRESIMKTRNEIYQGEGAKLLRFITTYHTLRYDQVLQLFSRHEQSIKSLITSLIKQGRIIYDKEHDLLCDSQQSAENPDYAIITCFWVLLNLRKVLYTTPVANFQSSSISFRKMNNTKSSISVKNRRL